MWSEGIIASPTGVPGESQIRWGGATGTKYKYWVKHYEEPSEEYGIDGGKVSKLTIRKLGESRDIVNYDRGWDAHCPDEYEVKAVYAIILERYN